MKEVVDGTTGAKTVVKKPENYTITFGEAGAMTIQADCNQAKAAYTLGAAGALTITPGPATLAACPEGSLGDKFLQDLGKVASFQTDGTSMVLTANADGSVALLLFQIAK